MTIEQILEEPLIISGVKNKAERLQRIRKVMSEVKLHPADDFNKVSTHVKRRPAAARCDCARHDP